MGKSCNAKICLVNFPKGVQGKWLEIESWAQNARLQEVDQSGTLVGGHLKPLPQVWWLVASLATCYLSEMHFWTPLDAACVRQDHSSYLRTRSNIQGWSDYSPSY